MKGAYSGTCEAQNIFMSTFRNWRYDGRCNLANVLKKDKKPVKNTTPFKKKEKYLPGVLDVHVSYLACIIRYPSRILLFVKHKNNTFSLIFCCCWRYCFLRHFSFCCRVWREAPTCTKNGRKICIRIDHHIQHQYFAFPNFYNQSTRLCLAFTYVNVFMSIQNVVLCVPRTDH